MINKGNQWQNKLTGNVDNKWRGEPNPALPTSKLDIGDTDPKDKNIKTEAKLIIANPEAKQINIVCLEAKKWNYKTKHTEDPKSINANPKAKMDKT